MTTLLSVATTAARSSNITLADGASTTLSLTPAVLPIDAMVAIELQQPSGVWQYVGALTSHERVRTLQSPGVYSVNRTANSQAFGVEQD